ncbi:MAG: hypothetical protein HGA38_01425 [Candidatus Moranbacteria bacterium]|nr:hypothetical protein [Candidatus Moranbacteria bacterium]NTW45675.1 hypothetical protein [Candidatus Moranbacteria bacterium]
MNRSKKETLAYFGKHLYHLTGIVLVWRGVWYILDLIDATLFSGGHILTALGGILVGLLLLYLPDGDLKEII